MIALSVFGRLLKPKDFDVACEAHLAISFSIQYPVARLIRPGAAHGFETWINRLPVCLFWICWSLF
jgi:hypothetical protein